MTPGTVAEEDLQAYVDGALDAGRAHEVQAWLEQQPEAALLVQSYRAQGDLLHAAFDSILNEPVPARLTRPARTGGPLWRFATAMSWLLAGTLLGWSLNEIRPRQSEARWPQHAALAHAVFVAEVRHPVEVRANEEAHLVGWLSKRLGKSIRAPRLTAHGFELLGGRLLPESARPGAQFMYQDAAGRRLTLYLSTDVANRDSAFRYTREGALHVFYWIDREVGYALAGELDKAQMLAVARTIYEQLNP
jgi:anti-sigma factor RsiW